MGAFGVSKLHIFSMFLLLVLYLNAANSAYKSFERMRYVQFLRALMVLTAADECSILVMNGILVPGDQIVWNYISKMLFFCCFAAAVYFWIIYSEAVEDVTIVAAIKSRWRIFLPFFAVILANLTNYWTHAIFSFKADGTYVHHYFFFVQEIFFAAALAAEAMRKAYFASYEPDPVKQRKSYLLADFAGPSVFFILFGMFLGGEPITSIGMVLAALYVQIGLLEDSISLDPLTRVNNRQQLDSYIKARMHNHSGKLFLIMMDIDYFKQINDQYGHIEGDSALVRVSDCLKEVCRSLPGRAFIARYGGDEFTIVTELADREQADQLCAEIKKQVRVTNAWEKAPYTLTISTGAADYDNDRIYTVADFIHAADEKLYEAKKARPPRQ